MRPVVRWLRVGAIVGGAAALIVGVLAAFADRYVRSDPGSCATCHAMQTPMRLWAEGEHRGVACQSCHALEPVDGLRMIVGMARGASPGRAHARVGAGACRTCHTAAEPRWVQAAASPGHKVHAQQAKIDCLACHGGSIHKIRPTREACAHCHPKVEVVISGMEEVHCFACHDFREAGEKLVPSRPDCLRCHGRHEVSADRFPAGAPMPFRCSACHEPHRPDLRPARACVECHDASRRTEVHRRHEKVACTTCHAPHSWAARKEQCASCHRGDHR